jgi:hypothetical protein
VKEGGSVVKSWCKVLSWALFKQDFASVFITEGGKIPNIFISSI